MQKEQAEDAEDGGYGKEGLEAKFGEISGLQAMS